VKAVLAGPQCCSGEEREMAIRNILTAAYFVLAIYMYGGDVMSTLVYCQSWKLVGEEEFAAVHSSVSRRILPFFGPVLVFTGLSQHSANLVSPSIYFHVVDRTHSGDSSAHGGHPFCGVCADS